jgi:hypothetical protein
MHTSTQEGSQIERAAEIYVRIPDSEVLIPSKGRGERGLYIQSRRLPVKFGSLLRTRRMSGRTLLRSGWILARELGSVFLAQANASDKS